MFLFTAFIIIFIGLALLYTGALITILFKRNKKVNYQAINANKKIIPQINSNNQHYAKEIKVESSKSQNENIQIKDHEYKAGLHQKTVMIEQLNSELRTLKEEYEKVQTENKKYKSLFDVDQNQKVKQEQEDIYKDNAKLKKELQFIKQKCDELQVDYKKLKSMTLGDPSSLKKKIKNEIISIFEMNKELINDIEIMKISLRELQSEKEYYETKNVDVENKLKQAQLQLKELEIEYTKYKDLSTNDDLTDAFNTKEYISRLESMKDELENTISERKTQVSDLIRKVEQLNKELIVLDEEILYQSFGLYTPTYNFASSNEYKKQLNKIRFMQKEMIRSRTAALCKVNWQVWRVNNNFIKGSLMINEIIKQVIRAFNIECVDLSQYLGHKKVNF